MVKEWPREELPENTGYVSSKLLKVLGGKIVPGPYGEPMIDEGAHLFGVENKGKAGEGVFNHVLLVSRLAEKLGTALKKKFPAKYGNLDIQILVESALVHDVIKLYSQDKERFDAEEKMSIGLPEDYAEITDVADEIAAGWLEDAGFSPEVVATINGHDFPETIVDNPYWKLLVVADYMAGQVIMTLDNRLADVQGRWTGKIPEDRLSQSLDNIRTVASDIFTDLGMTDKEFIEQFNLNAASSMTDTEKFLRFAAVDGKEEEAKKIILEGERDSAK